MNYVDRIHPRVQNRSTQFLLLPKIDGMLKATLHRIVFSYTFHLYVKLLVLSSYLGLEFSFPLIGLP